MIARWTAHVRALWGGSRGWGIAVVAPLLAWPLYCFAHRELRWELVAIFTLTIVLASYSRATKRFLVGFYPIALVGILFDMMRFLRSSARVHDCDLRAIEMSLFGVNVGGTRMTLHDWFQAHHTPLLDAVCAFPYGTFVFASLGCASYLYFKDYRALRRYTWTFFVLNVLVFATHHFYPAAPPWYFHAHGCAVDVACKASCGPSLARVDAAMGLSYFHAAYGRSRDVFGTMPSLHVTYPLLILLAAWKHFGRAMRALAIAYFAAMVFAAVYLDHHWVLDVVVGLTFCLAVHFAMVFVFSRRRVRAFALGVPRAGEAGEAEGESEGGAAALAD